MFRIESYITPIILSHIDKYVQDFRPKDAQVSLWGGEVAFQNLDLRLDVLEEELHLPFSFVSGHIHELTIRVPWTKIASESIQITINTIEFVLKLRTPEDKAPRPSLNRKKSRSDLVPSAPPGYMASLVNKIANNISLKLHNVILKYVEDDIVVSMNIQLLSFDSANELWQPDFVDINPTRVLLKKIINITDLTICLDKRNTMGIIDICQEPMLYRCSLQVRLLRRYNISSAHRTSLLRMDIFTDAVELNVSAQQYPMLLRLLVLANTLREGRMQAAVAAAAAAAAAAATTADGSEAVTDGAETPANNAPSMAGEHDNDADSDAGGGSMISWAWNMLPTLFPAVEYEEEHVARKLGHVLHTGLYINRLSVTFKSQELIGDNISNAAKKLKYHPLLRVSMAGLFASTVTIGHHRWYNATGGVSSLVVQPLGICVCGSTHSQHSAAILATADCLATHRGHMNGSLWDTELPEQFEEARSYDRCWESHTDKVRMSDLLQRTPAVAFDVSHEVDAGEESSATNSSQLALSNLEYSNLSESYVCRAAIGEFQLRYNTSALHIAQRLQQYAARYDYPPYAEEPAKVTRDALQPPAADDYDALMTEVPMRVFQITMQRPVLEMHLSVHDTQPNLPFLRIDVEDVRVQLRAPYYPNRLVYTTCLLPEPPAKLLDACYTKYALDFRTASVALCFDACGGTMGQQSVHLKCASTELTYDDLIYPHLWEMPAKTQRAVSLKAESFVLLANKPQLILFHTLYESMNRGQPVKAAFFEYSVLVDSMDTALPIVDLVIKRVLATYSAYSASTALSASINSVQGLVYIPKAIENVGFIESYKHKAIFLTDDNSFPDFISAVVQIPIVAEVASRGTAVVAIPPTISVKIDSVQLNVDPLLCDFLNYRVRIGNMPTTSMPMPAAPAPPMNIAAPAEPAMPPNAAEQVVPSNTTLTSKVSSETEIVPEESSLIQIYPLDRVIPLIESPARLSAEYRWLFAYAQRAAICVEWKPWTVVVAERSLRMVRHDSSLRDVLKSAAAAINMCTFQMPAITLRSAHDLTVLCDLHSNRTHPNHLGTAGNAAKAQLPREGFPWNLTMSEWRATTTLSGLEHEVLNVQRTSITIAVTVKTVHKQLEPSFVIHADTGPIVVRLDERQIALLYHVLECLRPLGSVSCTLAAHAPVRPANIEISARPTSPGYQGKDLKGFFGTVTEEETSTEGETLNSFQSTSKYLPPAPDPAVAMAGAAQRLSVWMQWTLSKAVVSLHSETRPDEMRFLLEMEDIISSYDQQDVYTKVRVKAGTLNGTCQTKETNGGVVAWRRVDGLGLIARNTLSDTLEETFIEVVITEALTKNVHGRWFNRLRKKRSKQLINTISEVMVTLQSIDVKVDLDVLDAFVPVLVALGGSPKDTSRKAIRVWSVHDFPIVHLKSEGVRVFFPLTGCALLETDASIASQCDVFFLKVSRITILPTTENPLYRKPIRGDIYTKATELNILNVPGSKVENRQYEIAFAGISLSSGKWAQIREHLEPSISTVKNAAKKNPAFDWNNLTVKPSVEIHTIFEKFNLSVVYAPCIVFEHLLVCGECLEVNCVTDLIVNLHTIELQLMIELIGQMSDIGESASFFHSRNVWYKQKKSNLNRSRYKVIEAVEQTLTDSGIESMGPISTNLASHRTHSSYSKSFRSSLVSEPHTSAVRVVPYDMSFVGGIFSVQLYYNKAGKLTADAAPSDKTDAEATASAAHPLISLTVFQPNVLVSQSVIEKITKVSVFNVIVRLGPALDDDSATGRTDFRDNVFVTRAAVQNRDGVPQPLLRIRCHILPGNEVNYDIRVNRPSVLRVSHQTVEKLQHIERLIGGIRSTTIPPSSASPSPSSNLTKFKAVRKMLCGADEIKFFMDETTIESSSNSSVSADSTYTATMGWSRISGVIELSTRQQRVHSDAIIHALAMHAGTGIILNPTTIRIIASLAKEPWKRQPLCTLSVRSTCLDACIGPNNVLNVKRMAEAFAHCLARAEGQRSGEQQSASAAASMDDLELLPIATPRVSQEDMPAGAQQNVEFYQDDLRAGAFQFVEPVHGTAVDVMPLPYQIQISSRDGGGLICWRYPQPRAVHFMQVFPVLFNMRRRKAIRCELQYYSAVHREFLTCIEFLLSDTVIQRPPLPEHPIIAEVWCIVVHQSYVSVNRRHFEEDEEDDDEEDDIDEFQDAETELHTPHIDDVLTSSTTGHPIPESKSLMNLHPRALVACIRIDSKFHARLAPNFEFALHLDHFIVSMRHDQAVLPPTSATAKLLPLPERRKPPLLRQYQFGETSSRDLQTLIKITQRNLRAYCGIFDDMRWALTAETRIGVSVLDMGFLTMHSFLDECLIKAELKSNTSAADDDGSAARPEVSFAVDLLRLHYGPCVGYSLSFAQRLWQQEFAIAQRAKVAPLATVLSNAPLNIPHRYVICNCTTASLKIAQTDADELLYVRSNECLPYAFRTIRSDQRLRVSTEMLSWPTDDTVVVGSTEQTQTLLMSPSAAAVTADVTRTHPQYLTAQTQRTGAGPQTVITMRGQIEFRNMTGQDFRVLYRVSIPNDNSVTESAMDKLHAAELVLSANSSMSLVRRCDEELNQTIKLRLLNEEVKGWSGDIPLYRTSKNTPWLVKVPTFTKQQFTTFWVRVLREDLAVEGALASTNRPQRLLIVFWPLFMVRSMLPVNLTAFEEASDSLYELAGRGQRPVELSIPGTHETEHDITFDTNSYFHTTTKLSYKAIDRDLLNTDLDPKLTLDEIRKILIEPPAVLWPCSEREEERRWLRNVSQLEPMKLAFNRVPSQMLSSCLMLDVVSACLVINSVGSTLQLINTDNTSTVVHPNNIAMPAAVTSQFVLSFMMDNHWYESCPIFLASETSYRNCRPQPNYEIADEGNVIMKILAPQILCKYQLSSNITNGVRALIISPHYVFINYTAHTLNVWPFCVLQRQQADLKLPTASATPAGAFTAPPQWNDTRNPRGHGINTFYNLSDDPADTNFNKLFNFFIAIRCVGAEDSEFCVPIALNRALQRHCFSIRNGTSADSIPLAVCIVEHYGQFFVSVYPDTAPCLRVHNHTAHRLFVAQADVDDNSATATPVPVRTLRDDQFEWYTSCAPGHSVYYTPPGWDSAFPEKMFLEPKLPLMIAACNEPTAATQHIDSAVGWSQPFRVLEPLDKFIDLPTVGDVRVSVIVCRRTVDVTVAQIDQNMEFNVKDIRTKLLRPEAIPKTENERSVKKQPSATVIPPMSAKPSLQRPAHQINVNAFLQGIHVTLYTEDAQQYCKKTELMAVYMDQIAVRFVSANDTTADIRMFDIEVDNQLHANGAYDFPVLMCMQPTTARPSVIQAAPLPQPHEIRAHVGRLFEAPLSPALGVHMIFCPDANDSTTIDEMHISMRPICAYIEDKYINVLLDYLLENVPSAFVALPPGDSSGAASDGGRIYCEPGQVLVPHAVHRQAADLSQPLRMRRIRIAPLSVLLSVHTCLRMYIALDHSPLDFGVFEREHVYSVPPRVGYTLGMHYVSGALFGAGWVVGSLEILGSPSGLARSVSTGLRDFVAMPVEGIMRGPWGLLVGITHGSASLIRNVTAGTVNSVTKLAASVARNLDWLTLDSEHLQRTEALRRQRPGSISEGISQGLTGLGISILGAVGGLSRHPLEAQTSLDVVAGFGRGLVGAVTKPISGAAELLALTGQGVLQTVGFNAMPAARDPAAGPGSGRAGVLLEPSSAKISAKYVPSAYGADHVLCVALGTLRQTGAVCVALCSHLLLVIDVVGDRVVEVWALERIALSVDTADDTLVWISMNGELDSTAEEQEFQYNRVLQYVNECSEMVLRPQASPEEMIRPSAMGEDLRQTSTMQLPTLSAAAGGAKAVSGPKLTESSSPAESANRKPSAAGGTDAQQANSRMAIYMDAHLARHLVQYAQLLQRISKRIITNDV